MKIYVDIDETICYYRDIRRYDLAKPLKNNIKKINKLYDEGNTIVYYSARATVYKSKYKEYLQLTQLQLKKWNCKYHDLIIGHKPDYDLMVCDKTIRIEELT